MRMQSTHPHTQNEVNKKMNVKYKLLGDVAEIIAGIPEEKKKGDKEYNYFCIQPSHLNDNNKLLEFDLVSRSKPINEKALVKKEDILIKRISPSSINLVMGNYKNAYVTSNIIIVRCNEKIQTISKKELSNINIPLPDIKTQKILGEMWLLNKRKQKLLNDLSIKENDFIQSLFNTILDMKGLKK